jgi:glycosyltransferase involved in cell wall biosynthesis
LFPLFKKCVVSFQNDPSHEFNGRLFPVIHLLFDKIILKNNSDKYMKYQKCIYFPNGVNIDIFKPMDKKTCAEQLGLNPLKKYILFFDSNKGKRTQKRYDRFKETMTLLKIKGNSDIEEIVLTNTHRELISLYMNVSALHLLCSDFEGSPNSVKECMACNTKVVSTDVGNVKELFIDTKGYFVSKTKQPEELAGLVEIALSTEHVVGRSVIIDKKLDLQSVAIKLKEIYTNL